MKSIARIAVFGFIGVFCAAGPGAVAGSHTWEVWEVFSNASGTVQFVTIKETHGGIAETFLGGHTMIAHPSGLTTSMHNVAGNTAFTFFLLGTSAFAALPGAPTPDVTLGPGLKLFQNTSDTSMEYSFTNTATWSVASLPTDGTHSLRRTVSLGPLTSATNSPTNFAGVSGSVDASGGASLPGVPDGTTGTPLKVNKLAADGSSLSISWDTATCADANNHQILYGQQTGFPAVSGGSYTLQGGTCSIGSTSPFVWTPTPNAVDGSGLTWFLIVTKNASGIEGPWGTYNGVAERNGTGAGGSSNVCTTTNKSLTATCGH
jgi:hypothetical protein